MDAAETKAYARSLLAALCYQSCKDEMSAAVRAGDYDEHPSMTLLVEALTPPEGYVITFE